MAKKKNIVVIGGGTGTYTVLSGLKKYPVNLAAIVSMADSGGSTGVLREEFGVLPPGDARRALVALSNAEKTVAELFNYRFEEGSGSNGLAGHNLGNLLLTALTKQTGSFEKAIEEAGRVLNITGEVIPSTLVDCQLVARLENGALVHGEADIDEPKHDGTLTVQKVWLKPKVCQPNPKALKAMQEADLIVIGPGDLYTSILPNFLVDGIVEALQKSKAKKVYVCNLMTKHGETNAFSAKDFVETLEQYIGKGVLDYLLVNTKRPAALRIKKYEAEQAEFVKYDKQDFSDRKVRVIAKDLLRAQGFVRHDSGKLAQTIASLLNI